MKQIMIKMDQLADIKLEISKMDDLIRKKKKTDDRIGLGEDSELGLEQDSVEKVKDAGIEKDREECELIVEKMLGELRILKDNFENRRKEVEVNIIKFSKINLLIEKISSSVNYDTVQGYERDSEYQILVSKGIELLNEIENSRNRINGKVRSINADRNDTAMVNNTIGVNNLGIFNWNDGVEFGENGINYNLLNVNVNVNGIVILNFKCTPDDNSSRGLMSLYLNDCQMALIIAQLTDINMRQNGLYFIGASNLQYRNDCLRFLQKYDNEWDDYDDRCKHCKNFIIDDGG